MATHLAAHRPSGHAELDRAAATVLDDITAYVIDTEASRKPTIVRGVVTGVTRDATGINQVSIQRTGQTRADGTPYTVYATMFVPIVGDRVTLQKLGSSWLVVGADHGGRPNEHTIAYPGGSHRRYNAARGLQHQHGDDHHATHHNAVGAVVHHHDPAGHKHQTGDHHHNATTLDRLGNLTGGHKHTHANGQYEHHWHNGTGFQRLRGHHPTQGHIHYGTDGATVVHHHSMAGHARHLGDLHHSATGIAADGTPTGGHQHTHNAALARYEHHGPAGELIRAHSQGQHLHLTTAGRWHLMDDGGHTHPQGHRLGHDSALGAFHLTHANGARMFDHNGQTQANLSLYNPGLWGTTVTHAFRAAGTAGGQTLHRQHGGSAVYHAHGDDGTGRYHAAHASGNRVLDHDGVTMRHYAAGAVMLQHDGQIHRIYNSVPGTGYAEVARVTTHANAGGGGQLSLKQLGGSGYHLHGDDGTGKVHIAHASGNRVLDHDGVTHQHYANGAVVYTHDGTTGRHYAGGVVATQHDGQTHRVYGNIPGAGYSELARHQSSGAGNGGQLALKQYNTTTGATHLVGDDGGGRVHLRHANTVRTLVHDGQQATDFYQSSPGNWSETLTHAFRAAGTAGGQFFARQHGSGGGYHVHGDDGGGLVHVKHASGNRVLDHDGTTIRHYAGAYLATTHDGATHTIYGAASAGRVAAIKTAFLAASNSAQVRISRDATTYHGIGDDGAGALMAAHGGGNKAWDHDGTTGRHYAGGVVATQHDGQTHRVYTNVAGTGYAEIARHQNAGSVGGGGAALYRQTSSASYHAHGDDGTGRYHARHASGALVHDHDGTTPRFYNGTRGNAAPALQIAVGGTGNGAYLQIGQSANAAGYHRVGDDTGGNFHVRHAGGNLVQTHDGVTATHYAGAGGYATQHDGGTHSVYSSTRGTTISPVVQHGISSSGGNGGEVRVGQVNNGSSYHRVGDDNLGNLHTWSQSGTHITHIGNGAAAHQHHGGGHIYPAQSRVNSASDRLDLLDQSNSAGAIKSNSHSVFKTFDDQPCTLPLSAGAAMSHGGVGDYGNPHFKFTEHLCYYQSNPGAYFHSNCFPTLNQGYGNGTFGSATGIAAWTQTTSYGDNHSDIWGCTYNSPTPWNARNVQYHYGINT